MTARRSFRSADVRTSIASYGCGLLPTSPGFVINETLHNSLPRAVTSPIYGEIVGNLFMASARPRRYARRYRVHGDQSSVEQVLRLLSCKPTLPVYWLERDLSRLFIHPLHTDWLRASC